MLLHWFIGFYACFVVLVFYFISGFNQQNRAQTSPFCCIHCSPKRRRLKQVKHHEPSHKNKPKESKVDLLDQNELELRQLEHSRSMYLRLEVEYHIPEDRSTDRARWLGSREVHSNFQQLLIISKIEFKGTGHPLDWSSEMARVEPN